MHLDRYTRPGLVGYMAHRKYGRERNTGVRRGRCGQRPMLTT
jgi:hypothetical protein